MEKNQQTNWHLWELSTHIVIKFIELRRLNVCSMFWLWGWQPLIDNESEWQQWWMGGGAMDHGVGGGCWQCHWRLHHCDCLTLTPVTRSQWKPAQKAVVLSLPVVMRDIAFTRVTLGKWSGQIIFIEPLIVASRKKQCFPLAQRAWWKYWDTIGNGQWTWSYSSFLEVSQFVSKKSYLILQTYKATVCCFPIMFASTTQQTANAFFVAFPSSAML